MKNGLYCNAGKRWFSVSSEGRLHVCNALSYKNCKEDGWLGNIITDDIKLREEEFFKCPIQECQQMCDRHWSKKQIYKDDVLTDEQDVVSPDVYRNGMSISLLFGPTWKCNYSCKYCSLPTKEKYPHVLDIDNEHSPDVWIKAFDKFFQINGIDGGIWHVNGGEPLFYDGIEQLFSYFYKRGFVIGITTNVCADVYKKIITIAPPSAFVSINCSLHPTDKNFRWELFKNRVELLKEMGYPVSVNFVGYPDQIMLTSFYYDWCMSIGISFSLIPLIGNLGNGLFFNSIEDYPMPMRNIIKKYTQQNLTDSNRFRNGSRI
jgi:MoaA/NifB/PqqE/SkfB family radical SAM enzyme